jgi:hypothetical protein
MEILLMIGDLLKAIWLHLPELIVAINAVLAVLILIALAIPGPQPEGWLEKLKMWLSKYSRK